MVGELTDQEGKLQIVHFYSSYISIVFFISSCSDQNVYSLQVIGVLIVVSFWRRFGCVMIQHRSGSQSISSSIQVIFFIAFFVGSPIVFY